MKHVKGFHGRRKASKKLATEALMNATLYAYRDRKKKKSEFRALWNIKINAAARPLGFSYSKLIPALKNSNIALDRKSLAYLAEHQSEVFNAVIEQVK